MSCRGRCRGRADDTFPRWLLFVDGDQPLSVGLRHIGRVPARRPASFFASPKKEARKATPPNRSSAAQPTALRCSQQAAGAELAGCARSNSCAGLPRLLLRCSAARKGLFGITARFSTGVCDRRKGRKPGRFADCTRRFSKGSVCAESPFRAAEQRNNRRRSPAQLFEPAGRVLRRPPDGSSAGESFAQRMTGEAGSPSLPTFLATQESRPPAGAGPGQRNAKQRKAAGPHQRTVINCHPPTPPN